MAGLKLSVVIPVYNKAPHLLRAVESALEQSLREIEVIIVDDASDDGTDLIISSISDKRVKSFRRDRPGAGGYEARNLGVEKASSDWIAFLDADDAWMPDHLERMSQLKSKWPSAEIFASGWCIDDGVNRVENDFFLKHRGREYVFDCRRYLAIQATGLDVVHTDVVVVKKSRLLEAGGFPQPSETCKRAGDGQTWLRIMLSGAIMVWSPHVGALYYQDAVNMVTRNRRYSIRENGVITYIDSYLARNGSSSEVSRLLKKYKDTRVLSLLFQEARRGEVGWLEISQAFKSFRFDPRLCFIVSGYLAPRATRFVLAKLLRARVGAI